MSFNQLQSLTASLVQAMNDDQKLAIPLLVMKLNKLAATYPEDKTVGGMARILSDMQYNHKTFIRTADFKDLSRKLYTSNTKFAQLFQEELGEIPVEPSITVSHRDEKLTPDQLYQPQDQILANALESAFDKHIPLKLYSQKAANQALKSTTRSLEACNLFPSNLKVSQGNDKYIIVQADYETPKGITSFLVPVEVSQDQVKIDPEVFIGNLGPEQLAHAEVKNYITSQAGSKPKITAEHLLTVLTQAGTQKREITAAELALTRLKASRQVQGQFLDGQILGLSVEAEAKPDVKMPNFNEQFSFEKEFATPKGIASQQFGEKVVITARAHLSRQLASFGFANAQIVVAGNDDKSIKFGISLSAGQTAFIVPVKIANHQIIQPTILICNGSISTFDQDGINQLVSNDQTDNKVAAVASTMNTLKPSEVLNNLRQAIAEENHAKAEDALNVLANCNDPKAHAIGFQLYLDSMAGKIKTAATKCAHQLKSKVSEYPVCAHTGLPVNKVYQDKDGFCRPMFRQGMAETYEGASFSNAKIFV